MSVHVPPRPRPAPATTNYVHLPRWLFLGTLYSYVEDAAAVPKSNSHGVESRNTVIRTPCGAGAMGVSPRSGLDHRQMRMDATQGERAEEEAYGSLA